MTRIPIRLLSGLLAALALSAQSASAENLTIHTTTPTVNVRTPTPQINVRTPQIKGSVTTVGAGVAGGTDQFHQGSLGQKQWQSVSPGGINDNALKNGAIVVAPNDSNKNKTWRPGRPTYGNVTGAQGGTVPINPYAIAPPPR